MAIALLFIASTSQPALAQQFGLGEGDANDEQALQTRIFSVADLVLLAPDYSFQGVELPGLQRAPSTPFGGLGGGFGGGGLGGEAQAGGGGFFQVAGGSFGGMGGGIGQLMPQQQPGRLPFTTRLDMQSLIELITTIIEPRSWELNGGEGALAPFGTMLIVRQTPELLDEIQALLMGIRETGGRLQSVTIRADWLLLEPGQLKEIFAEDGKTVIRGAVHEAVATSGASGQITCFDGQTVHIVSGRLQSGVSSVTPVVGQTFPHSTLPADSDATPEGALPAEVLAQQIESASPDQESGVVLRQQVRSESQVGYQPVLQTANFGALLQVTPSVDPTREGVVLDLRSLITHRAAEPPAAVDFRNVVPLDRLNVVVQQFMTTLHMPLGEPRLIAGSTLEPFAKENASAQLYLVVEVNLSNPEREVEAAAVTP
jgi:hypothetical protein